jgi:hypothetical protein
MASTAHAAGEARRAVLRPNAASVSAAHTSVTIAKAPSWSVTRWTISRKTAAAVPRRRVISSSENHWSPRRLARLPVTAQSVPAADRGCAG